MYTLQNDQFMSDINKNGIGNITALNLTIEISIPLRNLS